MSVSQEKIFGDLLNNLLGQVLLPTADHIVQTTSGLAAHLLAGLAQDTNIIGTLTTLFGKREEQGKFIVDFFNNLLGQVVLPTADHIVQTTSGLAAHLLAGLAQDTNIIGTLTTLFGKREEEQGKFIGDLLNNLLGQVLLPTADHIVQTTSGLAAHLLAGLAQDTNIIGTLTTLFGKRELKDFWTDLGNNLLSTLTTAVNPLLQSLAQTGLILTATLANQGVSGLLTGK